VPNNLSTRSTFDFHPRSAASISEFSVVIVVFLFQLLIESYVEFSPISRMAAFSSGSSVSARPCRAEADNFKLHRSVRRDADWP
jgi:hypothetical protein